MYLREMGGVELLSREGEIAIAKRIEAGKDVMLIALAQSPITAQQFVEWDEKLQKDEILVREIIDIDTTIWKMKVQVQVLNKEIQVRLIKIMKVIVVMMMMNLIQRLLRWKLR